MSATTIVTATEASATLTWNAISGAASYGVWRTDGSVAYVTDTSYTFTGLNPHQTYNLSVWARTADGVAGPSAGAQVTMPARPGVPRTSAPTNVTTSGLTASSVTVNWSGVAGATGYRIGRSGPERVYLAGTARSYAFSCLAAGRTYSIWLEAIGHGGISTRVTQSFTTAALPAQPSGLGAAATSTTITLSWDAVTGATGYDVKQGESGIETAVSSGTSQTFPNNHTFPNLTANTPYTLYVRAKNSGGVSEWASLSPTTAPLPPYVAPQLFGLSRLSPSHVELNWTNATGATGYEVKLGPDGAVKTAPGGDAIYGWHSFRNLIRGVEYTYYVRAVNRWGASDWVSRTTLGTAPPPAPTGLEATASTASLKLSWTAARPSDTTVYEVKLNAGGTATAAASINGHTFSSLAAGTTYTLYVRAKTGSRPSAWSPTTATTVPAAPSDLDDGTPTSTSITLSWTAVTGATGYEVKRSPGSETPTAVTDTSHTFPNLTADTAYTLYVRAKNSGGDSAWTPLSAKTARAEPSDLKATATSTSITLSWTAVTGATGYEVKRSPGSETPTAVTGTSHTFPNLTANTAYTLYVRAQDSSGAPSVWVPLDALTAPVAPTNLTITAARLQITLRWDRVTGATSYEVKYHGGPIATLSSSRTSATFTGYPPSPYTLYVRARNSGGASAWSPITGSQ